MKTKIIGLSMVALSLFVLLAGNTLAEMSTLDKVIKAGVVRVGIDLFVHPFGMYDKDNKPEGYDVDVANELAKALGVKLEIVPLASPGRITFLVADKVDVVISSFTRTVERAKTIVFTGPYAIESASLLTKKGSGIRGLADLKGKPVASVKGITAAIAIAKLVPDANLTLFDRHPDMVLALIQDKVVALADGDTACSKYIEEHPRSEAGQSGILLEGVPVFWSKKGG